jgi:MFS family permease
MTTTVPPTPPPATARGWLPPLLREKPFRRYWSAHTVSQFGDQVSLLALPLLAVLATDAGPAQMGYLTAAALAPSLLFSLLAGAVIDRFRAKRRVMIAADIGRALLLSLVPIAYALGELRLAHLYAVAFGVGTLAMLFEVSQTTLFVSLVPRSRYVDANTLLNGSRALSHVAGPSVGGVLVQVLTAPAALIVDAVSYLYSAVFLARIHPVEPAPAARRGLGIGEGLRYLVRSPVLRATMFGTTTLNLFNFMFAALFVLYVSTELAVSPGLLGAVLGVGALGSLLGAALTGPISRRLGIGRTAVAGMVLFPLPLVLVPLAGGPTPLVLAALLAAELFAGFGVMMLDIAIGSVQTAFTPAEMLARVAGAKRTINYGIRPIGALLGGALGATLGVRPTLWIATVGALAGLLWLLPSPVPAMRDLPEQPVA